MYIIFNSLHDLFLNNIHSVLTHKEQTGQSEFVKFNEIEWNNILNQMHNRDDIQNININHEFLNRIINNNKFYENNNIIKNNYDIMISRFCSYPYYLDTPYIEIKFDVENRCKRFTIQVSYAIDVSKALPDWNNIYSVATYWFNPTTLGGKKDNEEYIKTFRELENICS